MCGQAHCPDGTTPLLSIFPGRLALIAFRNQQIGILFPVNRSAFLMAIYDHNVTCIPENWCHHLPCWRDDLLWRGWARVLPLHRLSFGLLLKWWTQDSSWEKTGFVWLKNRQFRSSSAFGQASKAVAPILRKTSTFRTRAECSLLTHGRFKQYWLSRLSSITTLCTWAMFSLVVTAVGRPQL